MSIISPLANSQESAGNVVLLHGLARTAGSMESMESQLNNAGYQVCNIDYPSRKHPIEKLTHEFVVPEIQECFGDSRTPVHFVTHSLGGIIVRQLAADHKRVKIGRVVMLSPPNQGSEVVDKLGTWGLFQWINGPAGKQLGTTQDAVPKQLGPATFELGIITGNRSINLILSTLIPGPDDGKVSIRNAKLDGMQDFLVVEQTHPFIMANDMVQSQTLYFLQNGRFRH
ncbi:alpha/beta hydrolase [Methylophaga nitratireducenticrescens]|uniref:Lipase n=2 Tax=Methylophaga nitratireducenticrescens TaxID=754476 RepID=I1XKL6_METNJ|nr:alpha/beta hydrolase [Methylophaga nitratireducenticrescens]AUZ84948.1 alpha/beta hydrolase [Methylophaga nitratireducenticrescens]